MEAVHKLTETIEQARSSLSPSQLKKLRKKRGKLVQQVGVRVYVVCWRQTLRYLLHVA